MLTMFRRAAMVTGATAALSQIVGPGRAQTVAPAASAVPPDPKYPFTLPALPYAPSANEPHIDAQTMELHYDRHHAAYIANLNAAVKDNPQVAAMPLSQMLAKWSELPEAIRPVVRNSGGGHAFHSMFWPIMGGKGGAPDGKLAAAVTRDLGGIDQLRTNFNRAGAGQFGSGWAVVLVDASGKLSLGARPNQDSPLMDGNRVLFGNDVWEHAYYLKYQNRRPAYLEAWWNVVNWAAIGERYDAAMAGTLTI